MKVRSQNCVFLWLKIFFLYSNRVFTAVATDLNYLVTDLRRCFIDYTEICITWTNPNVEFDHVQIYYKWFYAEEFSTVMLGNNNTVYTVSNLTAGRDYQFSLSTILDGNEMATTKILNISTSKHANTSKDLNSNKHHLIFYFQKYERLKMLLKGFLVQII